MLQQTILRFEKKTIQNYPNLIGHNMIGHQMHNNTQIYQHQLK